MRCPVSDRHSDQTVAKLAGLCGGQAIVKVKGTCPNHQSGLRVEDGVTVNGRRRRLR